MTALHRLSRALERRTTNLARSTLSWWRNEAVCSSLDPFHVPSLNAILAEHQLPPLDEPNAIVDDHSATRFLLWEAVRLHRQFPTGLSDGVEGGFVRHLFAHYRFDEPIRHLLVRVFDSRPGYTVLELYADRVDLRRAYPLALTPACNRGFLHWLLLDGHASCGIPVEAALWFTMQWAEQPQRGLVVSYLLTPAWQREFPTALSAEGWPVFCAWVHRTFGVRRGWLKRLRPPEFSGAWAGTSVAPPPPRVLLIDDRIPHAHLGRGYPRTERLLRHLAECCASVTFFAALVVENEQPLADAPAIDWVVDRGLDCLEDFFRARHASFDVVIVSRPHIMHRFRAILLRRPHWFRRLKLVYDAEAIFCLRELNCRRLRGETIPESTVAELVEQEIHLASGAHHIVTVSPAERQLFVENGFPRVAVLAHSLTPTPTPTPASFEKRRGLLFVGPLLGLNTPNTDSIVWFARSVLPLLRAQLGNVCLEVAGEFDKAAAETLSESGVRLLGPVADLTSLYNDARVFVVPTRFAAGIPLKALEAAARGVPIVATSLIANQLGWIDGVDLLAAETAAQFAANCGRLWQNGTLWNALRAAGLRRIQTEYSNDVFRRRLNDVLG